MSKQLWQLELLGRAQIALVRTGRSFGSTNLTRLDLLEGLAVPPGRSYDFVTLDCLYSLRQSRRLSGRS